MAGFLYVSLFKPATAELTCRSFHSCSCSDSLDLSGSLKPASTSMQAGS